MTDWAGLITVAGGAFGGLTGILGVIFGWKNRQANYAQATASIGTQAADIGRQVAQDLRAENTELKADIAKLDDKVDQLRDVVFDLRQVVMMAVFRLEASGDTAGAAEIRAALNNRPAV